MVNRTVVLAKPHTHKGVKLQPGDKIDDLDARQIKWLEDEGVIEKAGKDAVAPSKPAAPAKSE